eukprot:UN5136
MCAWKYEGRSAPNSGFSMGAGHARHDHLLNGHPQDLRGWRARRRQTPNCEEAGRRRLSDRGGGRRAGGPNSPESSCGSRSSAIRGHERTPAFCI